MLLDELIFTGVTLALILLVAAVLLPLARWWSRIGLPKIGGTSVCAKCAYDLAGLPNSATCPECGSPSRPSTRLSSNAPSWVTKAWLTGSIAANLPIYASAIFEAKMISSVVITSAAYSLVLLGCFLTIARRPNKTAVIVAMLATLGLQFLAQLFLVFNLWINHRGSMHELLYLLSIQSILISAAGLAATSLIAILIIAMTPDTDLTPPASP